jgi:hypothetical protein
VKYFDDETTINQNIKRERKEEIEQRRSENKEKIKDKRKEKTLIEHRVSRHEVSSRSVYMLLNYLYFTLRHSISTQSYFIH